jgi:hypothetical protein
VKASNWRAGRAIGVGLMAVAVSTFNALPASAAPQAHPGTARAPHGASAPVGTDSSGTRSAAARPSTVRPADEDRTHTVPNPLLKEIFSEPDADQQVEPTNVSALCQSFIGQPTPYGPLAPNVDAIVGDTTVTVGSQAGCSSAQNETTISVNPFNPRNIVAGSNDYRLFNSREARNDATAVADTSFDGGRTWANVTLPGLNFMTGGTGALSYMDSAGDPSVAFGPFNTVYYATLIFSRTEPPDGQQLASGVAVSASHDGGLTWGQPTVVQIDGVNPDGTPTPAFVFNDKEWVTVDPIRGTVYVTWTRFTFDTDGNFLESPIMEARSTDQGRHFNTPVRVSPSLVGFTGGITPFGTGSNPVVQNNGTLQIAYETAVCADVNCDSPNDHDAVVIATSTNHGATFKHTEVSLDFDFPFDEDGGVNTLTGENFRINSFPQLTVDRVTDKLWVTWADDRNGQYTDDGESIKSNGDAFLTSSQNGKNWTPVRTLGTSTDEVYPAVAALGGFVAVSYYTRKYDPSGIGLDYAYQSGLGDGIRHSPVRRITTQTANPQVQFVGIGEVTGNVLQGVFIGDYTAMAVGSDFKIHPAWTDFRGNPGTTLPNQDVVTQSISLF